MTSPLSGTERGTGGEDYSYRNATIGSTFVARRAGTHVATSATATSSSAVAANVTASLGATSNSIALSARVTPSAASSPSPTPTPTRRRLSGIRMALGARGVDVVGLLM